MTNLDNPIFHDEAKARAHFEAIRWPSGKPCCPHCGVEGENTLIQGKSHRPGMYMCNACRQPFSVTVKTVMESSHIPLHKWAQAFHLMAASKKGISTHQLHRMLGITYKSAFFLSHRIREAMAIADGEGPLGGGGTAVEADEMFLSKAKGKTKARGAGGYAHKIAVVSFAERKGRVRSFKLDAATRDQIRSVMDKHVSEDATVFTDASQVYKHLPAAKHESVNHSRKEFARGTTNVNTVEGYFSVFQRGMVGTYQCVSEKHLHRYLAEFDQRASNRIALGVDDTERAKRAIRKAENKRLTYRALVG